MGGEVLSSRSVLAVLANQLEVGVAGWANLIGMRFRSNQEIEEYKWLGRSPAMREWRGNRIAATLRDNGVQIKNIPYEATIEVAEKDMRRDKFMQIRMRINQLAQRTNSHWPSLLSVLLNGGLTGLAYDGQFFYDTDHQEGDSGVLSNKISASDYTALNVADPTLPTAAEFALIMVAGMTHFNTFKDDRGEPIHEEASEFLVMVPPKMIGVANVAITANLLNGASGPQDNPAKFQNVKFQAVANTRLTAASAIHMFRTDAEDKPLIMQEEYEPRPQAKAEGSEYFFDTGNFQFGVDASRAAGYGPWQHALHMTLS